MNKTIAIAALLGVIAAAAYLLSNWAPLTAESAIAGIAVLGLLSVAALDYRVSWKRIFGRS